MKRSQLGKTVAEVALPRAVCKVWQASIWGGPTPEALTEFVVYGDTLDVLRRAAHSWLYEHRPSCFSNVSSWYLREPMGSMFPRELWALYVIKQLEAPIVPPKSGSTSKPPRNHRRSSRKGKLEKGAVPPSLEELGQERVSETDEGLIDANVKDQCPQETEDELAPVSREEETNESIQFSWYRMSVSDERQTRIPFPYTADAVHYFLYHDLLITKGPDFREVSLEEIDKGGLASFCWVKTIKVVDDEEIANDMLRRGGWVLIKVLGKLAPAHSSKTVLFVLGHVEEYAT